MKILIERTKKQIELFGIESGHELLKKLEINPTEILLIRNSEVILPEEKLSDTDEIQILSVVSGG